MAISGIQYVCNDETKEASVFFVTEITDELKQCIRNDLAKISYGEMLIHDDECGYYEYKRVIKSFLDIYDRKSEKLQKGMIGELLANILIRYYRRELECISVYLNKEENNIKKGYDIVYYDTDTDCIRYSEVKSGEKNAAETENAKNRSLLQNSKNDILDKFNDNRKKLWDSALVDASNVISSQTKVKYINTLLKQDQIRNENGQRKYSVVLISVLFSGIDSRLSYDSVCEFCQEIIKENCFENVIVFSIQKNTYQKIVNFLRSELDAN